MTFFCCNGCLSLDSYIKPQRDARSYCQRPRCLSLDSYIKPQPSPIQELEPGVVYLLIPTSNHNLLNVSVVAVVVVYLLIPTSNHNPIGGGLETHFVVYLLIPTSNHNLSIYKQRRRIVVYLLIPTSNHNSYQPFACPYTLFIS